LRKAGADLPRNARALAGEAHLADCIDRHRGHAIGKRKHDQRIGTSLRLRAARIIE
jgi:hypothetical protein